MGTMDKEETFYIERMPRSERKSTPEEDARDVEYFRAGLFRSIERGRLAKMKDEERVAYFRALTEGYCTSCGRELNRSPTDFCQCENNE